MNIVAGLILLPFKILWNLLVLATIIGGFVLWWGFLFGSVLGVVLILIFAPELFFLPALLACLFAEL